MLIRPFMHSISHPHDNLSVALMSIKYSSNPLYTPNVSSFCLSTNLLHHGTMASDITAPSDYDKVIVQEIETTDASHSSPELLNSHRIFSEESWKNSMAVKTLLKVSRSSHDYCFSPLICRQQSWTPKFQAFNRNSTALSLRSKLREIFLLVHPLLSNLY